MTAEDLYALPLDDFIRARDELASKLKSEGEDAEAKRVKALKKPNVVAWAVNQAVRRDPATVDELMALREQIETAHDAAALRSATTSRRKLVGELVQHAKSALEEAGHGSGGETVRTIQQTFLAADSSDDVEQLRAGTLTRPLSPSGFDSAFGMELPDLVEPERRATSKQLAEAARELDRAAKELERRAAQIEQEAELARHEAATARRRADAARAEADRQEG